MATNKEAIGLRVQPHIKAALEQAAKDDCRPLSSLVEKIVVEWLHSAGRLKPEGKRK